MRSILNALSVVSNFLSKHMVTIALVREILLLGLCLSVLIKKGFLSALFFLLFVWTPFSLITGVLLLLNREFAILMIQKFKENYHQAA